MWENKSLQPLLLPQKEVVQDNVLIGLCEVYLLGRREGEKNKNNNAIILVEVCATSHEMFVCACTRMCVCMLRPPSKQLLMFLAEVHTSVTNNSL